MYIINDDLSIYATRGDIVYFTVTATDLRSGEGYMFQPGDVVRMKIYGKKDAETVVLQKDFPVVAETNQVEVFLAEKDTKIGDVISKPTDYWYEIELNPFTNPQTIIGYDDDGAKVFKLFPEGKDLTDIEYDEEDIPVVDTDLDATSPRPVQNRAIARAIIRLNNSLNVTDKRLTGQITTNKNNIQNLSKEIAVERARITNLAKLEAGSTTGDAELADARVDYNGNVHGNAGEHIRTIADQLNDKIDGLRVDDPRLYGAKADGVTDDSDKLQAAMDACGSVYLAPNTKYKATFSIKEANAKVYGSGTLIGSIFVNVTADDSGYPPYGMVVIEKIRIESNACISMAKVRGFNINGCDLNGTEYGIVYNYNSENAQNVIRGFISNNNIRAKNGIYLRETNESVFGGCADITICNNVIYSTNRNITLVSVDGCIVSNNTLMMPGFGERNTDKQQNIYVDKTNWLAIENNTLFEAGLEGIRIEKRSRNTRIVGNTVGWCGQKDVRSGIYAGPYDTSATDDPVNMIIANNIISSPTKHGIEIPSYVNNVSVSGNVISDMGDKTYYYGESDIDNGEHYGILFVNQDKHDNCSVVGNTTRTGGNSVGYNIFYFANVTGSRYVDTEYIGRYVRLPATHAENVGGAIWYDPEDKKVKYSDGSITHTLATAN